MKLLPFNKELRHRLIQSGYRNIEIKRIIEGEYSWLNDDKSLQILKAVEVNDQVGSVSSGLMEHISSRKIDDLLADKNIHAFIIVDAVNEQ